jgi:hypothetical protein
VHTKLSYLLYGRVGFEAIKLMMKFLMRAVHVSRTTKFGIRYSFVYNNGNNDGAGSDLCGAPRASGSRDF